MPQEVYYKDINPRSVQLCDLHIVDNEHTPHWLRYGKGQASLEVQANNDPVRGGVWVSLDMEEVATERNSRKRVMLSLRDDAARALYKYLHEKFGR